MAKMKLMRWLALIAVLSISYAKADRSFDVQAALAAAKSGDTVRLPAGVFKLDKSLTLWKENLTLSGAGSNVTVLDFGEAEEGGQGILIRASEVRVEGISILNPPGDGLVARGVERLSVDDVRVAWLSRSAGGYGVYPVQCRNVNLNKLVVSGAVEAGIYVGQTSGAKITNSYVFNNVVGIDIENSSFLVVQKNVSKNNSIGISITGRPFLFLKNPKRISLISNVIADNNLFNFAPESSFVKALGSGIGLVLTAVRDVTVVENVIENHRRAGVEMINYETIDPYFKGDSGFDPGFSGAEFHENFFGEVGNLQSLAILSQQGRRLGMAATVIISGYDRRNVNTDFACFRSVVHQTVLLSLTDYFLASTLPCDLNRNIRI